MRTLAADLPGASALPSIPPPHLERFPAPLPLRLEQVLDQRLAKTFTATISLLPDQQ